jgi:type I restriction enzyme S subunit
MKYTPLKNIADVLSGFAFKSEHFRESGIPVIRIGDIQADQTIAIDSCKCVDPKLTSSQIQKKYQVLPNDILMALSGATTGKIGIAHDSISPALLNQRVAIIRSSNSDTQNYLKYIFSEKLKQELLQHALGAAQANLSPKTLESLKIPLPPIAEQKRIAAILDKADAVRRKRREAIRLTEELLRSVFLDMFGDPVTNPKGWDVVNFGDVCINFQNGIGKGKKYYGSGAKVANISDLYEWHKFTPTKYSLLESTPGEIEKYRLSKGDLLFVRSSVKKQGVAYCSFYNSSEVCLFSSFMIRARLDREVADPEFVSLMFRTTSMRERLIAASNTSTITNISQPALSGVSIIVPPLSEQKKLERAVKAIERMTNKFTQNQKESEDLFNSLLQRAFTGNL